jgi:hypothetical protein
MLLLHCRCSYIVATSTSQFFFGLDPFFLFLGVFNVCVFCVVCRFLVLQSSMWILHIFYVDFMCFIRIQTFVFYFTFLFSIFVCWFNLLLFFFKLGILYVHCVCVYVVAMMSGFL